MNKNIRKTIIILLALFSVSSLNSCKNHNHRYKEKVISPTCTESGYTEYTCRCGDTYVENEIPSTGHSFLEWVLVKASTDREPGLKQRQCNICDIKETDTIVNFRQELIYYKNGYKYLYLGRYPQSAVDDKNVISALNKITTVNSKGYIEYKGNEYKKIISNSYKSSFNCSNKSSILPDYVYYYKVEPIKWMILESSGNTYKLLSHMILDYVEFYDNSYDRIINDVTIYQSNYEYSNIRAWLNGYDGTSYNVEDYTNKGFIDIAFTSQERELINDTLVDNSLTSTGDFENQYICNNTIDKIYLLSYKEVKSIIELNRCAQKSNYAIYINSRVEHSYYGENYGKWMLRTPGGSASIKAISENGQTHLIGFDASASFEGVCASLEIKIE